MNENYSQCLFQAVSSTTFAHFSSFSAKCGVFPHISRVPAPTPNQFEFDQLQEHLYYESL